MGYMAPEPASRTVTGNAHGTNTTNRLNNFPQLLDIGVSVNMASAFVLTFGFQREGWRGAPTCEFPSLGRQSVTTRSCAVVPSFRDVAFRIEGTNTATRQNDEMGPSLHSSTSDLLSGFNVCPSAKPRMQPNPPMQKSQARSRVRGAKAQRTWNHKPQRTEGQLSAETALSYKVTFCKARVFAYMEQHGSRSLAPHLGSL